MADVPRGVWAVGRRGNKTVGLAKAPRTQWTSRRWLSWARGGQAPWAIVRGGVAARDELPLTSHSARATEVAPIPCAMDRPMN